MDRKAAEDAGMGRVMTEHERSHVRCVKIGCRASAPIRMLAPVGDAMKNRSSSSRSALRHRSKTKRPGVLEEGALARDLRLKWKPPGVEASTNVSAARPDRAGNSTSLRSALPRPRNRFNRRKVRCCQLL